MKSWGWIAGSIVGASLLVSGCGNTGSTGGGGGNGGNTSGNVPANAQVVHVTASNWKWTLDKTTFKAGQPIDFQVTSKDGAHGFSIQGTSITQPVEQGGSVKNVVWTPSQPGTYLIRCDIYCGAGHSTMTTPFTVQ